MNPTNKNKAFTLIELLTVIAVIGVLAAILIPAVSKVKLSANTTKSVSNLRQIGNLSQLYVMNSGGRLPATGGPSDDYAMRALYPLSQNRSFSFNTEVAPIAGTIYNSPLNDDPNKITYAVNWDLQTREKGEDGETTKLQGYYLSKIKSPPTTLYMGESTAGWKLQIKNMVYNGSGNTTNLLFCDMHIEALTHEEFTARTSENPAVWRPGKD